jgi:hypothetical protein
VWDADAGQELLELPRSGGCNFNAAWSPTVPGVFATASFDGKARGASTAPLLSRLYGSLVWHWCNRSLSNDGYCHG